MKYTTRKAKYSDYKILKDYKRHSIFDYADNLSKEEIERINNYLDNNFNLEEYMVLEANDKIIGAYLVNTQENLLDEIFIEEDYRGLGIGTSILKELINKYPRITLWVYKNNKAVYLYQSLGFVIDKETDTRYHMVHVNEVEKY